MCAFTDIYLQEETPMKKLLAIILSLLLIVCTLPVVFASSDYDRAKVAADDAETIAALTPEQIAGVILDWVDRQIEAAAADFGEFNQYADITGMTVPSDLDGIIAYKDHVAELEGDFAALDMSALKGRTEAGSDIAFINSVISFVAANSETFGKVFAWEEGQTFDFGKVGEYIEAEFEPGDAIRDFYDDYLIGNDIQSKFVSEIAREMGYEIQDGETFDDVINNGIKAVVGDFLKEIGLLSEGAYATLLDDDEFNLRTENAYALVKKLASLIQADNKAEWDETVDSFLSYIVGAIAAIKSAVNLEPPTVTIGDANGVIGTYQPLNTDVTAYMPKIYSPYKDQLQGTEYYDMIEGTALPEEYAPIVEGEGRAMAEKFVFDVAPVPDELDGFTFPIEIGFDAIKEFADAAIAEMLPTIQQQVDGIVAAVPIGTNSVTINSITVDLSYKGYATDDEFVVEVTADPDIDYTATGMISMFKSAIDNAINTAIASYIKNPAATVVVDNLSSGDGAELAEILDTVNSFRDVYTHSDDLLDFEAYYDEYNGVIGQVNRVLCDALKLVFTEEGYESLDLTEGGNENLTANLQKLCNKVNTALELLRKYVDRADFIAIADSMNIGDDFASAHGFNAGMVYDLDASSVEAVLVCGIRIACDMLVEDESGTLYDIHLIVEDLDSLEKMAVGIFNYFMPTVVEKVNEKLAERDIDVALSFTADKTPEDIESDADAKDYIFGKLVDILYDAADQAVPFINAKINEFIASAADYLELGAVPTVGFELGVEKGADWEATLTNLVNRFYELTDGAFVDANIIAAKDGDVYAKIDAVANDFLPLGSMLSNAGANGRVSSEAVIAALDACLAGNFDNFLRLFDVKDDALVGTEDSVTESLIAASEHMVDPVFPDTVKKELYIDAAVVGGEKFGQSDVQEYFTSSENDVVIASNNMKSLDGVKATFIPAALNLVRESGVLPFFAAYEPCPDGAHVWSEWEETKAATCTAAGEKSRHCTICYTPESGTIDPLGHEYTIVVTAPTCTECGYTTHTCVRGDDSYVDSYVAANGHSWNSGSMTAVPTCTSAGAITYTCTSCGGTRVETIAANGHTDSDGDGYCDTCNADLGGHDEGGSSGGISSFFAKIRDFFQRIINWIKGLFSR